MFDLAGDPSPPEKLVLSVQGEFDHFGYLVAVSGKTVVIGAPFHGLNESQSGTAYEFDLTGGESSSRDLSRGSPASGDNFGFSVSVSGGTALVGAPGAGGSGAAYTYDLADSSSDPGKLGPDDLADADKFGHSVSVSDGMAAVGAPGAGDTGAAYLYDVSGDTPTLAESFPAEPAGEDQFGHSVAVSDGTLVVGALGTDAGKGVTYAFDLGDSSSEPEDLSPDELADGDRFGHSVAVSGETLIVGAPRTDGAERVAGAAYVYDG